MTNPFLILHKVRGEPAFDIAIKLDRDIDDEPIWIIPTSGHRAYPYWQHELAIMTWPEIMNDPTLLPPLEPPPNWPDHYEVSAAPGKGKWTGRQLLEKLGLSSLAQPKPFKRRF